MGVIESAAAEARVEQGMTATGSFRCTGCGHTVTVIRSLPSCAHCSGSEWVAASWSPFAKARN